MFGTSLAVVEYYNIVDALLEKGENKVHQALKDYWDGSERGS